MAEKRTNKLRNIIGAGILGAVALVSGCASDEVRRPLGNDFYYEVGQDVKFGIRRYDIKMDDKKVPPHKDDAGFLFGDTAVNASGEYTDVALAFKTTGAIGYEKLSLTGGLELRLNSGHPKKGDESTDDYMYDFQKQSSDTREWNAAYCFDKIEPFPVTLVPTVGVRVYPHERLQVDVEYGTPFTSIKRTWGHHRYNKEDPIGEERATAFGQMAGASVTYLFTPEIGMSAGYEREWTKFGDVADVTSNIFFLGLKGKF
jgi:hypothetical protein